jgi:hypothetical protein
LHVFGAEIDELLTRAKQIANTKPPAPFIGAKKGKIYSKSMAFSKKIGLSAQETRLLVWASLRLSNYNSGRLQAFIKWMHENPTNINVPHPDIVKSALFGGDIPRNLIKLLDSYKGFY